MSLLTIIQGAVDRIGSMTRPTTVVTNTDPTIRQLLSLAQQEGKELARIGDWQALKSEKTFITVALESQATASPVAIPTDFDWYLADTMYNRTSRRKVNGPLSGIEWQQMKATLVTLVNPAFRFRGNAIFISPTPTAGETVAYEYMTKNWCQSSLAVAQSAWAADTDTAVLDEEFHILGLHWRWKKAKGLDYAEEFSTYQMQTEQALMRDGGRPRISADPMPNERVPVSPQIPDTYVIS